MGMKKGVGMKNNGAIRKLMVMIFLSILGSYCVGSDRAEKVKIIYFDSMKTSVSSMVESIGQYCSELVDKIRSMFVSDQQVEIQSISLARKKLPVHRDNDFDSSHGFYSKCTDGQKDCYFNEEFFDDTYFTGKLDLDPKMSLDADMDPMTYKKSRHSKSNL